MGQGAESAECGLSAASDRCCIVLPGRSASLQLLTLKSATAYSLSITSTLLQSAGAQVMNGREVEGVETHRLSTAARSAARSAGHTAAASEAAQGQARRGHTHAPLGRLGTELQGDLGVWQVGGTMPFMMATLSPHCTPSASFQLRRSGQSTATGALSVSFRVRHTSTVSSWSGYLRGGRRTQRGSDAASAACPAAATLPQHQQRRRRRSPPRLLTRRCT